MDVQRFGLALAAAAVILLPGCAGENQAQTVQAPVRKGGDGRTGEYDAVVSRVHSERAARVLAALHVPVTLDIVDQLGHALSHHAICLGSLRLLQGIYEGRRATLH